MSRRGFTLIELLVVMAIFAVLFALMTPALTRMRRKARAQTCASNLRQLYMASLAYTSDGSGKWLPRTGTYRDWDGDLWIGWIHWYPYDEEGQDRYYWTGDLARTNIVWGTIWDYVEQFEVYVCPSHRIANPEAVRSYAMYNRRGPDTTWAPLTADRDLEPAQTVMFAEVEESRLGSASSGSTDGCQFYDVDDIEFRHSGNTANVVFFDGHQERGDRDRLAVYFE
ncbi:MAG: type II secretion system protein [Lentisphaerae bacterium]|nr:type II secretion system protein [Lentisphaerota bacterium]